jgi:hypothetical protein
MKLNFLYQCTNFTYSIVYLNDRRRLRSLGRYFFYKIEQMEYHRLSDIRSEMLEMEYKDKLQMTDPMKWVLHLKEVRGKRYGRWWQVRKL